MLDGKWPDFIICGVMKCGTSVTQYALGKHPQIKMARATGVRDNAVRSEMFFWNERRQRLGFDWYRSCMVCEDGQISGEKTACYCDQAATFLLMKRYMPDLKLIYLMRDPVERWWSHLCHLIKWEMLKWDQRPMSIIWDRPRIFQAGIYANHLNSLEAFYPAEQVFVTTNEQMAENTHRYLLSVQKFLGVKPVALPYFKKQYVNWKQYWDEDADKVLLDWYAPSVLMLEDRIPTDILMQWRTYRYAKGFEDESTTRIRKQLVIV